MDILDKSIEINELYDVYQDLLTKKQKEYFESYYYNDFSITEISDNFDVSRNAVHDQLKKTVQKLYDYESKLQLRKKEKKYNTILTNIKKLTDNQQILELIEELEKVE
ncbi:MAG: hypothetical protein JXR62_00140 [Bacilli bacterium]|nr:hypothetical protein [Bacilli bacterium]